MHLLRCTENTPSNGWCWNWRAWTQNTISSFSLSPPFSLTSSYSPTARSTNLFFSNPMFLFTTSLPSAIYWVMLCTCIFRGSISPYSHLHFIPFALLTTQTLWLQCITQSFAIRLFHSLSFFPQTSISETFISLATLSFDWLSECSFVKFRGFLSIPKCR